MFRYAMIALFSALGVPGLSAPAHAFVLAYGSQSAKGDDHSKYIQELVEAFRKDYPQADVMVRPTATYLKPVIETLQQSLGEEVPDVAVVGTTYWPLLERKQLLKPLADALSASESAAIFGAIRPELLRQRYGKNASPRKFALPFNRSYPVLFINLKALPQLRGKTVLTWSEIRRAFDAAAQKAGPKPVFSLSAEEWICEYLLSSALGHQALSGRAATLANEHVYRLFDELKAFQQAGYLKIEPSQPEPFMNFVKGAAPMTLLSLSAYESVRSRVEFDWQISMPPEGESKVLQLGGGDLVLPKGGKTWSEKDRRDVHDFLVWYYRGRGTGLWSRLTGYLPLTGAGLKSRDYQAKLKGRAHDAKIYANSERWRVEGFYDLDEYCNITAVGNSLETVFQQAINQADTRQVLAQAELFMNRTLAQPCKW